MAENETPRSPANRNVPQGAGKPRLLFLCQTLPFPPDGGVEIRTFNVLRLLSEAFDVTALCFYRAATRGTSEQVDRGVAGLAPFARAEAFAIPHERSRSRLIRDHLRSLLSRRAYTYFTYQSGDFRRRLQELLREEHFDLVHLDSLDLSAYLPDVIHLPVICTHQNVESDLLKRRAATETFALMRHYVGLQARLTADEERRWCDRVALNVAVSEGDAARLRELVPGARVTVVPNGVDTSEFQPGSREGSGLVFVGGYGWYPNRDAMEYFARSILPLLRQQEPQISLTWVGRAPHVVAEAYAREFGITLTGYVEDIRPIVQESACFVVPLRVGGGSRLKILDAWAMGMPIVSTSIGCEGLDARDGENMLIRDTPEEFADGVLTVLNDKGIRSRLRAAARATAEKKYDWKVLGDHLIREYKTVLNTFPDKQSARPQNQSGTRR